ncbi:MAG: hypothetical protein Q8O27_01435 [Enterobacteriaceae bacterium]|nr:hypothetical protein [Enterobacteriaceae bacterium]
MILGILKSFAVLILFFLFMKLVDYTIKFIFFAKNKSINNKMDESSSKSSDSHGLNMLQCEKCKTYIVKTDAHYHNGKVYCKKEHIE